MSRAGGLSGPAASFSADAARARTQPTGLVDAAAVAEYLGVDRGYVYEHAVELGARRLGDGPKSRLRFSLAEIDAALTSCSGSRGSSPPEPAPLQASRPRRRRPLGTPVELLPIRGARGAA